LPEQVNPPEAKGSGLDLQEGREKGATDGREPDKVAGLEKAVSDLSKRLTVTTASEEYKLVLGGSVTVDALFNTARPFAQGTPFFLLPRPLPGVRQATFDTHARQTSLFALVSGPRVGDFETGGLVAVNLYNDAIVVDRYGILPLQAYAHLKNDDWRFAAGLQLDVFNPLDPTVLPFSQLGGSGNTGAFRGQVRAERYFRPSGDSQVTLTVGLSEPVASSVNNSLRVSEDNGWPNVEGRAAVALGPLVGSGPDARRPVEVGWSGVVGQLRTTLPGRAQVVADVWGLGSDARWAVTERFGVKAEGYVGRGLGTYNGGILTSVNPVTFRGIRSAGGWGEVYYFLCPETLHTHAGYGIDDPVDHDLSAGLPVRNQTYFANLIWDPTKHVRVAFEVTYRRTSYTGLSNNDGVGFHTQFQWKF
jgi:hypothetical protein